MRSRIDKSALAVAPVQHVRRPDERKDTRYLSLIRRMRCIVCGRVPCEPHHLLSGGQDFTRGMALKSPDRFALPVDRLCHDAAHAAGNDEAWFAARGIDGRGVAKALYAHRNDEDGMKRIIERSLMERKVYV